VTDPSGLLHSSTRDALDALGLEYEVMACDPALADTAAFVAAYGVPLDRSANTIVVASKGASPVHVACVLLATTSLDVNNAVRREMGVRKASFARAEPTVEVTAMEIGGVTPFGLPPALPVLVDARVMAPDWTDRRSCACHPMRCARSHRSASSRGSRSNVERPGSRLGPCAPVRAAASPTPQRLRLLRHRPGGGP
jgi:prolyl-tRNA editing enzyme YbaK/EbsC (Cys-tRNA(Pro) deacylase)